ncbi:MAG: hypothetical protein HYU80_04140 [Candidatus Blackburnbacteria bacterium]|nr:hypothetical protein [Candidatus Blackburnbacteria bacterium]
MSDFDPIKNVLKRFDPTQDRYISREFQKYAYDLAQELGDIEHKSLYMRLAKNTPRQLLEQARYFVKDSKANHPPKLFMWKLKQLKDEHNKKIKNQT